MSMIGTTAEAHYEFEADGSDSSGNGHDLVIPDQSIPAFSFIPGYSLAGRTPTLTTGRSGNAMLGDPTQYKFYAAPDVDYLHGAASWSIACWCKPLWASRAGLVLSIGDGSKRLWLQPEMPFTLLGGLSGAGFMRFENRLTWQICAISVSAGVGTIHRLEPGYDPASRTIDGVWTLPSSNLSLHVYGQGVAVDDVWIFGQPLTLAELQQLATE
jgi:hypothetical protein